MGIDEATTIGVGGDETTFEPRGDAAAAAAGDNDNDDDDDDDGVEDDDDDAADDDIMSAGVAGDEADMRGESTDAPVDVVVDADAASVGAVVKATGVVTPTAPRSAASTARLAHKSI